MASTPAPKPPSALKHNKLNWSELKSSDRASIASLRKQCLLSEEQLKTYYFPSLTNTPYPKSEDKAKQAHLYLKEHCIVCGQSKNSAKREKFCCKIQGRKHAFATKYDGLKRTYTPTVDNPGARRAVVLSTIKVDAAYGKETVVKISVVDFLTGEILVDSLVYPDFREVLAVVDWKFKTSMIDAGIMAKARQDGKTLKGVEEARKKVFEVVGKDTIIVGFDLRGDFEALGLAHGNVADYKTLYSIHCSNTPDGFPLPLHDVFRTLMSYSRFKAIRTHGPTKTGCDSLEDAMATREIILLWVVQKGKGMGIHTDLDKWLEHYEDWNICRDEWLEHGWHEDLFGKREESESQVKGKESTSRAQMVDALLKEISQMEERTLGER